MCSRYTHEVFVGQTKHDKDYLCILTTKEKTDTVIKEKTGRDVTTVDLVLNKICYERICALFYIENIFIQDLFIYIAFFTLLSTPLKSKCNISSMFCLEFFVSI